jgi:hypothetical protein
MADPLNDRIDRFARRHPRLMVALTLLAALATTIVLLVFSQDQKILYKAF